LVDAGISAEFVGDKITGTNTVPAEGHGGFDTTLMARQLLEGNTWTELNGTQIPNNFANHIPDIVIIQLGTNDAINASEDGRNPVPTYEKYMKQIVDYLRSKNPSVKIIIPRLIPSQDKNYDAEIIKLNAVIPDFVRQLNSRNSKVATTKDLRDGWEQKDFSDNVHPGPTWGQPKIAKAYFDALMENEFLIQK
jgi:lysophospholipase L1-like esterase